ICSPSHIRNMVPVTRLTTISLYLQPGQPLYVLLYASAIIFFCFFYTALTTFNEYYKERHCKY
ncbi:hypothetical protein GPV76_24195, partial [Salmonella enterica subsp. enterica serovar Typhimurium]|nr:hypothetical protein [Salmonella enterica subsp. enterica serovar Typhimurium]